VVLVVTVFLSLSLLQGAVEVLELEQVLAVVVAVVAALLALQAVVEIRHLPLLRKVTVVDPQQVHRLAAVVVEVLERLVVLLILFLGAH
jgi:tellurite resistance-related uncharacterized protein